MNDGTAFGEQRGVAGELDDIAAALFGQQKNALARDGGDVGNRRVRARFVMRGNLPAAFVAPPTGLVIAQL